MSNDAVLQIGPVPSQSDPDVRAAGIESPSPEPDTPAATEPTRWRMVVLTFLLTYALTAIIIPRETAWLPHWWSFYQTNVVTNVLLALAMTYLLPTITRLLRRWLH